MPDAYYRVEVRLPRPLRSRLAALQKEAQAKTGRFVSMSSLIEHILEDSLKRYPAESLDEEKANLFLLLSSS